MLSAASSASERQSSVRMGCTRSRELGHANRPAPGEPESCHGSRELGQHSGPPVKASPGRPPRKSRTGPATNRLRTRRPSAWTSRSDVLPLTQMRLGRPASSRADHALGSAPDFTRRNNRRKWRSIASWFRLPRPGRFRKHGTLSTGWAVRRCVTHAREGLCAVRNRLRPVGSAAYRHLWRGGAHDHGAQCLCDDVGYSTTR